MFLWPSELEQPDIGAEPIPASFLGENTNHAQNTYHSKLEKYNELSSATRLRLYTSIDYDTARFLNTGTSEIAKLENIINKPTPSYAITPQP